MALILKFLSIHLAIINTFVEAGRSIDLVMQLAAQHKSGTAAIKGDRQENRDTARASYWSLKLQASQCPSHATLMTASKIIH